MRVIALRTAFFVSLAACVASGSTSKTPKSTSHKIPVQSLADRYVERIINMHPEYAYFAGVSLSTHDNISSNRPEALAQWQTFEDELYADLVKIEPSALRSRSDRMAYWFLKEDLEASKAMRVCKRHLWNVDPEAGWQRLWLLLAQVQPVGSIDARREALARWDKLPAYVEMEIANLKLGMAEGYTMSREIVQKVIVQLQTLLDYELDDSPFMVPATRDGDAEFVVAWTELVSERVRTSLLIYKTFLQEQYLGEARTEASILSLPNGDRCYQAYIRKHTTTNKTGEAIFIQGQGLVSKNIERIESIGKQAYGLNTFSEIILRVENDPANRFSSADEILETDRRLVAKAKRESNKWFASLPVAEITLKPYEEFEAGSGAYEQSAKERPAYFRMSLWRPEVQQKGSNEVLVFHETYPGHHVQIALEKEKGELHRITKFISFTSYVEGWARYSEQLAEEMGLYESAAAKISRRAWQARGMVVDPGVHLKGWSKREALDYMTQSGMSREKALGLYDRVITMPAQLTSYDVGGEEIKTLRTLAQTKLGQGFDIKAFHSKVLENGALPLGALRNAVVEWIEEVRLRQRADMLHNDNL